MVTRALYVAMERFNEYWDGMMMMMEDLPREEEATDH